MELDLEQGRIDAAISYFPIKVNNLRSSGEIPAPFIAAIWPNVSSKVNRDALLTTSMIYRYDSDNPQRYFQGEGINHLASLEHLPGRFFSHNFYPYDPKKGADLARLVRKKSKSANLLVLNPELSTLAEYFADVLSRDRLRTRIVKNVAGADAVIGMVPFYFDDPLLTMAILIEKLAQMPDAPRKAREQIELAAENITSARKERDDQKIEYFANLARHRLIEDLGSFHLFRPSLFFIAPQHIQGMSFDGNGRIDLRGLFRLVSPDKTEAGR
jgi:hypothetical protein